MAGVTLIEPYDRYLPPNEVVARLRKEFRYVRADKKRAVEETGRAIEFWEAQKARGARTDLKVKIAEVRKKMKGAIYVMISDVEKPRFKYLATVLHPDSRIVFGFSSQRHEKAAVPLIRRCTKVLGYEVEEEVWDD